MDPQSAPAISFDTSIGIVESSPFAPGNRGMILARDAGQSTLLIQFTTIGTAVGGIDKAIRQLGSLQRHLCDIRCPYQGHNDGRPGERSPARAMHRRLRQERAQLLNLAPTSHTTKNRCQMHRILLLRPFAGDCIIITEPAMLPHQPRLHGKLVGDLLPPCSFGSKVDGSLDGRHSRLFLSKKLCPAGQYLRTLRHTCLQVHRTDVLDDGATGLLRTKAAGDILSTFPGTGINGPAFGIPAMLQPPAEIGRSFRIEAAQPEQVALPTHYLVATPQREAPLGCGAADLPVVGDHVVAAILTYTGQVRMRGRLEMPQDDFGGKFRIGIAEEERIHRRFSQDQAWCLYLHPIENVRNEAHGGAHDHPQRLEVVHQTTTPAFWPITRKLRSATPELLIIGPELRLRTCNLFNAIFPMLVGLIL